MEDNFLFDKSIFTKLFYSIVRKSPYSAPYLFYLQKRAVFKYNFQAIIGEQGSGKSYWAIIEAMALDPTFDITRIIFSSMNFLDVLDQLEDRTLKGRNIVWDDAGVGLPSDEWYSISNRVIRLVQQTVRTLHPTIKFTMPDIKYIDATQRRTVTCILDCRRDSLNKTKIRIYTQKRIRIMDKSYHRKFVFRIGNMDMCLGEMRVQHLPEEMFPPLLNQYEELQKKFKYETRKKLKKLLEGMREEGLTTTAIDDYTTVSLSDMEKKLVYEVYESVFKNTDHYLNPKRKIDIDKVMLEHKVSKNIARAVERYYSKKMIPKLVKQDLMIETISN